MKKKYAGMLLGVVVAAVLLFVLLPGVRIVGPIARLNVDESFYFYDMETEEIIGTVPVTLNGYLEDITGKFHGTICVEGYELQYPQESYTGHIQRDEVVFWVHDTEMRYNGHQQWDNFYGDYNYYVRVCRNHGNRIVCCVLTQNEGFGENGGSYSGRYYALQGNNETEALELYRAYNEEMKEKSTVSTEGEDTKDATDMEQEAATDVIPEETIPFASDVLEESSSEKEAPDHLQASGDVDGDGTEENLILGDFDTLGTKASLWVAEEKVWDLQGQGELGLQTCRLATIDMDGDGQQEVVVLISEAASINDASFRYIQWDGETWQEWPKVSLPKLEMTLDNNWQCTLTDGTEAWTVEVMNPTLRAEWFDTAGVPIAGPLQVGTLTSNADHIIEEDKILFRAYISVRDLGDKGGSWEDIWGEPTVTVSYENGQLVTDDALCQAVLSVLAKTGE